MTHQAAAAAAAAVVVDDDDAVLLHYWDVRVSCIDVHCIITKQGDDDGDDDD